MYRKSKNGITGLTLLFFTVISISLVSCGGGDTRGIKTGSTTTPGDDNGVDSGHGGGTIRDTLTPRTIKTNVIPVNEDAPAKVK